jgi:hypothetical protein
MIASLIAYMYKRKDLFMTIVLEENGVILSGT